MTNRRVFRILLRTVLTCAVGRFGIPARHRSAHSSFAMGIPAIAWVGAAIGCVLESSGHSDCLARSRRQCCAVPGREMVVGMMFSAHSRPSSWSTRWCNVFSGGNICWDSMCTRYCRCIQRQINDWLFQEIQDS